MKAVIYTAICGGYDELRPALAQVGVDCEYVAFTDGTLPEDRGWKIRYLPGDAVSPRLLSRLPKAAPQWFFTADDVRWAIWVDGSVEIKSESFAADLIALMADHPLGAWAHPQRDCIYAEAAVCQPLRKYQGYDLLGQVADYRAEGFPEHDGLLGCTVLVWDMLHPDQAELAERWWREQERYGTMDQLSLPVILWRMGLGVTRLPHGLWLNPWLRVHTHTGARDELKVNLGCADALIEGWENVDITPGPGVTVVDLRERWPWADGSVQRILAADVIEHLPDKVFTMNEMHRVLASGCIAEVIVPSTDGPGAFQDPTHVSFWNRNSFRYYTAGDPYRERFAASYGITAAFMVHGERTIETQDGPKIQIALGAVK